MKPLVILSPIHRSTRQLDLYLDRQTRALGVSSTEGHLLTYLLSYAPCPISELHRVFGLKRSTLTSLLDRLEEGGLLSRKPHPRDRRSLMISLSGRGKTLAKKLYALVAGFEQQVLDRLKPNQLKGFHQVMEVIEKVTEIKVREGS